MLRSQNRLELLTICRDAIVLELCNSYYPRPLESDNATINFNSDIFVTSHVIDHIDRMFKTFHHPHM